MHFTVVYINDRFVNNVNKTILTLSKDMQYEKIDFFDAINQNPYHHANKIGIRYDNWDRWSNLTYQNEFIGEYAPYPGQLGHILTFYNIFTYMIKNNIEEMLVLEDDALLLENFKDIFKKLINNLPSNYDFISLYKNTFDQKIDTRLPLHLQKPIKINDKANNDYLNLSYNQRWGTLATIFSKSMAHKMIEHINFNGISCPTDDTIFDLSRSGYLNGYSIKDEIIIIKNLDDSSTKSIIKSIHLINK